MFNLIGIGERAGSGVPDIYSVWEQQGWEEPVVEEQYNPDRTILTLSFAKKQAEKTSGKNKRKRQLLKTLENKESILSFLSTSESAKTADIAEHMGLSLARTRVLLSELADDGKIQREGKGRSCRYCLSAVSRKVP